MKKKSGMHFAGDLVNLFIEVRRVIKKGGLFAFTIAPLETEADYIKETTS